MPCPFPGMDPYIERSAIWPDFHDSLITSLSAGLQPQLRPRYVALIQDRFAFVGWKEPLDSDIAYMTGVAPLSALPEAEAPALFDLEREVIRQPLIHIIEPAAGNRLVTAIEVLSPDNKAAGDGREAYLKKRDELWAAGANLVEIDLLRAGDSTARISTRRLEALRPWHYLVLVTRKSPARQEVYPAPLQRHLPRVGIPLAADDRDVVLDVQAAFMRCWDEGPYPELLGYAGPPPGRLTADELTWCTERLRAGGFTSKPPG